MLKIFNTLSGKKETFKPINAEQVGLYACGITVYDLCHIGHARSMVVFDMVVRYLRYRGYEVNYVRNITDIDDKIIRRAADHGEAWDELTDRMIDAMHQDERELGLLVPDHEPRATQYITEIVQLIERLIENDTAYVAENGDVCFAIDRFDGYGKLSKRNIEDLIAGTREISSEDKRNPLDFVLWKQAKVGEPSWSSPWGDGRPGWHIECSAMSTELLGQPFDIHGGGLDLKFPHHENEIAQSEAACGCDFAKVWMHAGLLKINGEKMSKSLGNFLTIREVLEQYHADTLRCFMLSAHYRSPVNFSDDTLAQMHRRMETLYTALRGFDLSEITQKTMYEKQFNLAMDDDFNTPKAMAVLSELATEINRQRDKGLATAAGLAGLLRSLCQVLGLGFHDPIEFLQGDVDDLDVDRIDVLIETRNVAHQEKDWAAADAARDELSSMGVTIEDGPDGTTWRRA